MALIEWITAAIATLQELAGLLLLSLDAGRPLAAAPREERT